MKRLKNKNKILFLKPKAVYYLYKFKYSGRNVLFSRKKVNINNSNNNNARVMNNISIVLLILILILLILILAYISVKDCHIYLDYTLKCYLDNNIPNSSPDKSVYFKQGNYAKYNISDNKQVFGNISNKNSILNTIKELYLKDLMNNNQVNKNKILELENVIKNYEASYRNLMKDINFYITEYKPK